MREGGVGGTTRTFYCFRGELMVVSVFSVMEVVVESDCGIVIVIGGGILVDMVKCVVVMITNRRFGENLDLYEYFEVVGRA